MDERRKHAYRYLLYWATLDIRPVLWMRVSWNPFHWRRDLRRARWSGALAEWMHNLALFSSLDFQRFSEERFWQDYDWVRNRFPEFGMERYQERFETMTSAGGDGEPHLPPSVSSFPRE